MDDKFDITTTPVEYRYVDAAFYAYGRLEISQEQLFIYLKKFGEEYAAIFKESETLFKKMKELRHLTTSKNRNMEVVYIMGSSGSGKTTVAKYLADQKHFDYFISGTGEDFMDGYDKQECIVLDDFRAGTMRFSELLKFLDNHTNSSVKSRYNNKDVSNCKLVIITSVFEPSKLYKVTSGDEGEEAGSNQEPLEQLMRRLKHTVYEVKDNYLWKNYEGTSKKVLPIQKVYDYFGIDPTKTDDDSILDDLWMTEEEPVQKQVVSKPISEVDKLVALLEEEDTTTPREKVVVEEHKPWRPKRLPEEQWK